ncbi:MAG: hypothetical protein A2W80_04830 [Candidatus Riflebacteria bacterium GWC2_50_8]|nr:MAG: hypothetical protein A2W80_04830 [Candidatus Riflebacteria bacterium GWC2_50_8]
MRAPRIETEVRKEQIAEAALEIVGSQGIHALTMDGIAAMIGVVPSALYKHFKNKQQIMLAILELIQESLRKNYNSAIALGRTPLEKLNNLFHGEVRFLIKNPAGPMIFSLQMAKYGPESKKMTESLMFGAQMHQSVAELIRTGQKAGEIRADIPADNLVFFYFSMVHQFGMVIKHGTVDVVKHTEYAWKCFFDMIRKR